MSSDRNIFFITFSNGENYSAYVGYIDDQEVEDFLILSPPEKENLENLNDVNFAYIQNFIVYQPTKIKKDRIISIQNMSYHDEELWKYAKERTDSQSEKTF